LAEIRSLVLSPIDPEDVDVTDSKLDTSSEGFAAIARDAVRSLGGVDLPIWLYIEAGDGWVEPSLYQIRPDAVEWTDPDMAFVDIIENAWYALDTGQRWAVMEMDIADGRFTSHMRFPGEVPTDGAGSMDRREAALAARFGDKPVIYPD
jgi:hypothetical protein